MKAGALEAGKRVAAAVAEALHVRAEARCRWLDAELAKPMELAPFHSGRFELGRFERGRGRILRA